MKDIDEIVHKINLALSRQSRADMNLEATLISWGMDSKSVARNLRSTLMLLSEDPTKPIEHREYARQKLEDLPPF